MAKAVATVTLEIVYASVWAVVFSNYEPAETHSVWATKELAEEQAEKLDGPWGVEEWSVGRGPKTSVSGVRVDDEEAPAPGAEVRGVPSGGEETEEPAP